MKTSKLIAVVVAAVVSVTGLLVAQDIPLQAIVTPSVHIFGTDVSNRFTIAGVAYTGTAAQLNDAVGGTSSSVLLSNAVLKVYGSNLVIKAGGTVSLPAGSLGAAAITEGATFTITNSGAGYTNLIYFVSGVATGRTTTGTP